MELLQNAMLSFSKLLFVDLPTYFVGTIMWVLIVLVGHVTLVVSEFTVLSGFARSC